MKYWSVASILILVISGCGHKSRQDSTLVNQPEAWEITGFEKADSINPILVPDTGKLFHCPVSNRDVRWEERNVLNPSAVVNDGKVYLVYRAQDNEMTSRLGIAVSSDGLHFTREPEPVFYPANDSMKVFEWKGGVEDPRITCSEDGRFIMTYTAYDGKTARLCLATSPDMQHWTKHGPVLRDAKYKDLWTKSGAIVSKLSDGRITAVKLNGRYWMYFGDTDLFLASSDDLIRWSVLEDRESGRMVRVLCPRPGYFDSRLVEPGPCAMLTDDGILLIYNGSNAATAGDQALPAFTYAAGQALFDPDNPFRLIGRGEKYFIHPDKPYERTGEVNEVCFVEGLVRFRGKWFLYYGTADSKIAVAVKEGN